MWHEARKQERMIRGMIVDYRRRAERRKDFYEKIKAEPTQFLQLHGRPCKIHLDPAVAAAGEGPAIMMPWQGDPNNMIDRFDVRAHLDYIPEVKTPIIPPEELSTEERQCNYERYRILAQNVFLGISEDKFLQQLAIEEQYGVTIEEKEAQKEKLNEKKGTGAAIGYNYNDPGSVQPSTSYGPGPDSKKVEKQDSDDESDLEIIDVDLSIDVNKMEASQAHELNSVGPQFGMAGCDLFSFLTGDADDAEHQKQLLREEKEKAMFSGRKSRRERRAHRDKKLATRVVSPPSYAAPSAERAARSPSRSPSRTPSPDNGDSIQFITSFGGDDDEVKPPVPKPLYAEKVKSNLKKVELYADVARKPKPRSKSPDARRPIGPRRQESKSRSRSRSYSRSTSSRERSRDRSRERSRERSRSRSRSYSRSRSRSLTSRSRSRSRSYSRYSRSRSRSKPRNYRRHSRSPTNHGSKHNDNRTSFERESKPAVPRYYGRKKDDASSSELSLDSAGSDSDDAQQKATVGNNSNSNQNQLRLSGSSSKGGPSRETISLKEKLKRKMQAQLARQLRADKKAEALRMEKESRRLARRDEEMRQLAIKLRRKQREMRHQQNRRSSEDDSDDKSRSGSSSRGTSPPGVDRHSKSRSKSPIPEEPKKRIPVWETNRTSPRRDMGEPSHYQERRRIPENIIEPKIEERHFPNRFDNKHRGYEGNRNYYEGRNYDNRHFDQKPYDNRHFDQRPHYRQEYNSHYENRWEDKRFQPGPRRPFGHRGGYRGYGRPGHSFEGSSHSWQGGSQEMQQESHDRSDGNHKSRVKLVDY